MKFSENLKSKHQDCIEFWDNRTKIVLRDKEKKRTYEITNSSKKEIGVLDLEKMDCFLIDKNAKNCDKVIVEDEREIIIFIEFKGQDFRQAYKQLENTIKHFKQNHLKEDKNYEIYARLVVSKINFPHFKNEPNYRNLIKQLGKTENFVCEAQKLIEKKIKF